MKRYVKNLIMALLGRNPYREELDELKEKYEKTGENVRSLRDMYYDAVERWTVADREVKQLQALTENLRERIREKDKMMDEMQKENQRLIDKQRVPFSAS